MLNKENAKMRIKYFGKSIFPFFGVGVEGGNQASQICVTETRKGICDN